MFLESENKLLSGSRYGITKIWNLDTLTEEYPLESELAVVTCGCRIYGTSKVAIGGNPFDIKILDINTRKFV